MMPAWDGQQPQPQRSPSRQRLITRTALQAHHPASKLDAVRLR